MNFYPTTVAQLITDITTANGQSGSHDIYLTPGADYVFTASNNTYNSEGPNALPAINRNITIHGGGAQFRRDESAPNFRFFYVISTYTLTLNDLTIKNGRVSYSTEPSGGAIACEGTLNLNNCIFSNNVAIGTINSFGGAVVVLPNGTISANGCLFLQNSSSYGGAIDSDETTTSTITACKFDRNISNVGGAFGAGRVASVATVVNSQFINNRASSSGGAISLGSNSELTVSKSRFQGNSAPQGASIHAFYVDAPSTIDVSESFFVKNTHPSTNYTSVDNESGNTFDALDNWWGAKDGPSGAGSGHGDPISDYVSYDSFIIDNEPIHTCDAGCIAYRNSDGKLTDNPISLQYGEKRAEATDIAVNTPAGVLALTRSYRQSQQSNTQFQFMGLGWTHNHSYLLQLTGSSPNRTAVVYLDAGSLDLEEDSANAGHFVATLGSTAELDYDSGSSSYILTLQNKNTYVFDDTSFLLTSRSWPSTETWSYTYSSGRLSQVDDGYGRQLNFSYINNPGNHDHNQLWRVGDHTASGLSTGSPNGRYVEYSYEPERDNGSTVTTPKALLTGVHDLRGNDWAYDYYGQHVGESATAQLNFMTERLSPSVDTTGDGTPDGALTLESVTYTMSGATITGITQQRGIQGANPPLLETALAFQPSGENITTETVAGLVTTHRFDSGIYTGTQDPLGNYRSEASDPQFRPESQIDAKGNATQLFWSDDARDLNKVVDAVGNATAFAYNVDGTLATSYDAQAHKTEYTYGDINNPRLPTLIKVIDTDGATVLRWQTFTYDMQGRTLTESEIDPSDGTTILRETTRSYYTSGNGDGMLQTVTQEEIGGYNDIATTYTYDSAGRVIKTQHQNTFGSCDKSFTFYDEAGNVLASICNYDNSGSDPTDVTACIALFDPLQPEINRVTVYEYDTLNRRVATTTDAGADYEQTTLTIYDALNRVIRTISNYVADVSIPDPYTEAQSAFDHGSENNQNMVSDTAYNKRGMVRKQVDVLGNVTLFGYDDAGRLIKTVSSAAQPSYNNDYGVGGDPSLTSYSPNTVVDQDLVTSTQYDANGNVVKSVSLTGQIDYMVYDALNRPVKTIRSAKTSATIALNPGQVGYNAANDPRADDYIPDSAPDRDLIDLTEYDAMGRVIRTRDALNNWTLFGYDALGRQVRVIRSAATPDYEISTDPTLVSYSLSSAADEDLVSQTVYDTNGRVLYTIDLNNEKTWVAYDGLGRQNKTIVNAVGTATDGSSGDPRSTSYTPSSDPDRDLITSTIYDTSGRVERAIDVLGRITYNVYDTIGRVVRTVGNWVNQSEDPGLWMWNSGWKKSDGTTAIAQGTNFDQNIISSTVYDARGRVFKTIDNRNNETLYLYDTIGRRVKTIVNYLVQGSSDPIDWIWSVANSRWEDGAGNAIAFGTDGDQNQLSTTTYDLAGRVISTRNTAGQEMRYEYDTVGRRTKTIRNYENGTFNSAQPDRDLITTTTYNKAGQVQTVTDTRGTQTAFEYDVLGRTRKVTQAVDTELATASYTCFDKGGRVLRTIQNYVVVTLTQPDPDATDGSGNFLFQPTEHGEQNDQNIVTSYTLDKLGRQLATSDTLGNGSSMVYRKDGQIESMTDPEGTVTQYRYDRARRRRTVVQGFQSNGEDPSLWIWSSGWKKSDGTTAILFGTDNDGNIIVRTDYDKASHMVALRDPRGNQTTYAYDGVDRRLTLTNPLSQAWASAYENLTNGKMRVTLTSPASQSFQTQQEFDRLGRLKQLDYLAESPKLTPDVSFAYDAAGNRIQMLEKDGATTIRETIYGYDAARRLTSVAFDTDGDTVVDETISYAYDAGGLRTKLTLPGSLDIVYNYDTKGRLVSLTDWDTQQSKFTYDALSRPRLTDRPNGLYTQHRYDASGRLHRLTHMAYQRVLSDFAYEVDKRGNRVKAAEIMTSADSGDITILDKDDVNVSYPRGTWVDDGSFKRSDNFSASMQVTFTGTSVKLTMGVGPTHGRYDVYIDDALWETVDGYATSNGERTLQITLFGAGSHTLEVRNRADKHPSSTGFRVRFKSLTLYTADLNTWTYSYDALARVLTANRYAGSDTTTTADLAYTHAFDVAGNRTSQSLSVSGGSPSVTNYTYDAANRLTSGSATYDAAGRLTSDGTNTYTWDRANRLLSMGSSSYTYNGLGQRIQQTISATVTNYLLDQQPGLFQTLTETTGANTERYIHGPMGLLVQQDAADNWEWMVQDGLGSIRGVVDNSADPLESRLYSPYGELFTSTGIDQTPFGFTGESTNSNGLVYLRTRYYIPALGVFSFLDSQEGNIDEPMSMNRYSWVQGNAINHIDAAGNSPCGKMPLNELLTPAGARCFGRQQACKFVQDTLFAGNTPDWHPVMECYGDYMDLSPATWQGDSYEQGMTQAINDRMAREDTIRNAIRDFQEHALFPEKPHVPTNFDSFLGLTMNGYIEGLSVGGNALVFGAQGGREIVYNFATFQKAEFQYGSAGWSISDPGSPVKTPKISAGASLSTYFGLVSGFKPTKQCGQDIYETFRNQYQGESTAVSASAAANLGLGANASYFYSTTKGNVNPDGVQGYVFGPSVGVGLDGAGGASGAALRSTYFPTGNQKSYIYQNTALRGAVDSWQLEIDIDNNVEWPFWRFGPGAIVDTVMKINPFRPQAKAAARNAANLYNATNRGQDCNC